MKYGVNARVGNKVVFSREGAIDAYKIFVRLFDKYRNMEASIVLGDATEDMIALGFTYAECEDIENLVYAEV
jgi:hypothetical protein